jgi:hypothetical protein
MNSCWGGITTGIMSVNLWLQIILSMNLNETRKSPQMRPMFASTIAKPA